MNKLVTIVFLLLFAGVSCFAQYEIKVKIHELDSGFVKLGYHLGNKQYILDSTKVEPKKWMKFEGEEDLNGGIYFIVVPDKGYFEFLVDQQKFSLETTAGDYAGTMKVKGSKENEYFYEYITFISEKKKIAKPLQEAYKAAEGDEPKQKEISDQLKELDKEVKAFQKKFIKEKNGSFYAKYLKAISPPKHENPDSTYDFKEYKKYFWKDIDFQDPRLVRTPLFYQKVEEYLDKLSQPIADTISMVVDELLSKAEGNEDLYQFLTVHMLNKYSNAKIMGLDAVYVHIVDNYYTSGKIDWVDSVQLFRITDRAELIRPNLIGKTAPNFRLKDKDGNAHTLHKMESPYIVIYFWDPDCGHCKKSTPKVVDFYNAYKEKGVKVITITTEHEEDKWIEYLDKHDLPFLNLQDFTFKSNFRRLYDVSGTPRIFILDKDKKIIAKRLGAEQLPDFMDRVLGIKANTPMEMKEDHGSKDGGH